ncbi:uncharacterized protein LOC116247536 [Nymphaea colorata]|uniref:Auxin-responsive protein n=1 Tax=Nymphaea colorata TaxID=210225 RepID=A0A5K1ARU4_9MAGN|nr:uncharacterized protein LOC116247536 [Nymphaea colorata]
MPAISRFISRTLREVHHSYQIAISTVLKFMVVARNRTSRSQKPMDRGIFAVNAVCLKRVVSRLHGRSSRFAYHQLSPVSDGFDAGEMQKRGSGGTDTVRVVVGRERRVFEVDSCVLEEDPFQVLFDLTRTGKGMGGVIFVDCDSILFEHMLWLLNNDWSSFFNLKLKDIIEFYAQDSS